MVKPPVYGNNPMHHASRPGRDARSRRLEIDSPRWNSSTSLASFQGAPLDLLDGFPVVSPPANLFRASGSSSLRQLVEVKLAAAEVEGLGVVGELLAKRCGEVVDALLALLFDFKQTGFFEDPEML